MNPSPPLGQGDGRCLQVVWGRRRGPRRVVPIESRASFPGEKASLARLRVHSRGALLGRISPAQEFPLVAGGSGICRRSLWTCRYLPGDDVCGCAVIPRQAAENRRWLCPSCGHRGAWMGWAELQALHLPQLAPHVSGGVAPALDTQHWVPVHPVRVGRLRVSTPPSLCVAQGCRGCEWRGATSRRRPPNSQPCWGLQQGCVTQPGPETWPLCTLLRAGAQRFPLTQE